MNRYYDKQKRCLVFESEEATSDYWDNEWDIENLKERIISEGNKDKLVYKYTAKYIKPDKTKKILEGGCGIGQFVYSLWTKGYDVYGIDYAEKTINKLENYFPEIKYLLRDIRKTDFPDGYFDGYWSLGVIEHYFDGYEDVANEMKRVVKDKGFLFITIPYMSRLRKIRAYFNFYPKYDDSRFDKRLFYQYALDREAVIDYFENINFRYVYSKPIDGLFGLRNEVGPLNGIIEIIYGGDTLFHKIVKRIINILLSRFSGHVILLIFQKIE